MTPSRQKLIERAETAARESKYVDFKREFDVSAAASWCEVIKDIVAMANSGGGIIVFGVENDGSHSQADTGDLLKYDLADLINKIARYTGHQFSDVEVAEIKRGRKSVAAFLVGASDIPMIFVKPGTYDIGDGKQKTAFGVGTVYFRHGAKSEHGTRDDFVEWRDREVARLRQSWLGGIRKVVHAPQGHNVIFAPTVGLGGGQSRSLSARISSDPKAPSFVPTNAEEIWPHRQAELLKLVNAKLPQGTKINGHDIFCVNRKIDVFQRHKEFAYKPHKLASPQYSEAYGQWLLEQYKLDPNFFATARAEHRCALLKR